MTSIMKVLKRTVKDLTNKVRGKGRGRGAPRSLYSHQSSIKHHLFPSF